MFWLSKQPSWSKNRFDSLVTSSADPYVTVDSSRNIRVSTLRYGQSGVADAVPGEEEYGKPVDPKRRLTYMPTHSMFEFR